MVQLFGVYAIIYDVRCLTDDDAAVMRDTARTTGAFSIARFGAVTCLCRSASNRP